MINNTHLKIAASEKGDIVLLMYDDWKVKSEQNKFLKAFTEICRTFENNGLHVIKATRYNQFRALRAIVIELDGNGYDVLTKFNE